MEDISRIDKQLSRFDERLRVTELKLEKNNTLTEQNTIVLEKVNDTMSEVQKTMVAISCELKENKESNNALKENVNVLSGKFFQLEEKVGDKMESIDNKSKIDTSVLIRDIILKFSIGGGSLGIILYFLYAIFGNKIG